MKLSKIFFLLAVATISLTSCGKDDTANGIAGTWVGSWGFGTDDPSYSEKWVMENNGDMTVYDDDGDLYATGHFTLDGVNFEAEYTPIGKEYSYLFTGLYGEGLNEIIGNWGEAPSSTDGGTFEMYKQ